jgi:hypothetical protein
MKIKTIAASILLLASTAVYAGAPDINYSVSVVFDTTQTTYDAGNTTYNRNTPTYLEWGDPSSLRLTNLTTNSGTAHFNAAGVYSSPNTNRLQHHNDPISSVYSSLTGTDMIFSVALTATDGTSLGTLSQKFDIYFDETTNYPSGSCAQGAKPCGDIFVIDWVGRTGTDFSFTFDPVIYNGYAYTVTLDDNGAFSQLDATACAAAGASAGCIGFVTAESSDTNVYFDVTITAVPVPEPETYAMLLAGLGIVGMVARRRRNRV